MSNCTQIENNRIKPEKNLSRDKIVVRTSIIAIITNVLLAIFKMIIGLFSNSIAIIMDAINNIPDAGSSIVTIIGTKLAAKEADKKHPFGYGRIEYLSAMIISVIIIYAGVTSLFESIKKIIDFEEPNYDIRTLVIIAVAVVTKIILGNYVKKIGKKVNSDSLVNSGQDALMDSVISASTLVAAVLYMMTKFSIEAYLASIISIIIIKAGFEMLMDTISKILGERGEIELFKGIKNTIKKIPDVHGVYDLVLNNYGPDSYTGSVHIGVMKDYTIEKLDDLIKKITDDVADEHKVYLTGVSIYCVDYGDEFIEKARRDANTIAFSHKNVLEVHGFRMHEKEIVFDVVVSFDEKDRPGLINSIREEMQSKYPDCNVQVILDSDFAEY